MRRFLSWRKMTWVILAWGALMAVWLISGAFVMTALLGPIGLVVLTVLWFMYRPLWRQGHGARFRRLRSFESKPVRSFKGLIASH
jgi:hypothetical protein